MYDALQLLIKEIEEEIEAQENPKWPLTNDAESATIDAEPEIKVDFVMWLDRMGVTPVDVRDLMYDSLETWHHVVGVFER